MIEETEDQSRVVYADDWFDSQPENSCKLQLQKSEKTGPELAQARALLDRFGHYAGRASAVSLTLRKQIYFRVTCIIL